MPGMRLFGRRCSLATDDFLVIGIIDSIIFLLWLGWAPVIYASYLKHRPSCNFGESLHLLDISLPGLCILFFMNWLIAALFVVFSVKGSISQPEPRRHVVTVVYVKLFINTLDVVWAILGTVILIRNDFCDILGVTAVLKVGTIFQWVATVVRIVMIIIFYDWSFSKNTKERVEKEYFTAPVRKGTFKRWNLRLHTLFLWCTTPTEARKQALETASELLALLSCDLDLVASDVIAGLLLYRQKCLLKWKSESESLAETAPITSTVHGKLEEFPPAHIQSWMNLQLASRYMNLGLGVFGWPWLIYRNVACGCCILFKRLTCCFPFRKRSSIVLGDNCCGCQLAGLQATTDLPYEDLVHVSFVDKVFEVPFFVTYDHQTSAVIVTLRGTMSMNDVLTDVAANFASMDDEGCPSGALCHGGMLHAAREVKSKLEQKGILDASFRENPGYDLVITGHSLGASVASILTLLYIKKYPNVRCFAFAPPPTVNKIALPLTFHNIFTIIYGNDSVCYLNYENVKNMIIQMVQILKDCKLPKYKIFMNSEKRAEMMDKEEKCTIEADSKNYGTNGDVENKADALQIDLEKCTVDIPCVTESVYVAGTILHIRKTEEGYRLRLSTADDYRPLLFRPKSITDHFPQYLQYSLEQLGKEPVLKESALTDPVT